MFAERLSVWKAREKAAIGKGKRKAAVAPPPMPFKTKNDRPNLPARLANSISSSSTSAPLPKRPRIEPSTSEQGRGGKENGPFQRSEKPISKEPLVQKKPEKPALRIISGGVAEEMEKRLQEKLKWSERQKQREEEVRKRKEAQRSEEAVRLSPRSIGGSTADTHQTRLSLAIVVSRKEEASSAKSCTDS